VENDVAKLHGKKLLFSAFFLPLPGGVRGGRCFYFFCYAMISFDFILFDFILFVALMYVLRELMYVLKGLLYVRWN